MNLLAFDTSTHTCSVALIKGESEYASQKTAPKQQAALILPMIQALLDEASISLNELDAIAFGCGPGSFTGIRVASSVAQGLGFAYSLPIFHVSTLAAIAMAANLLHGAKNCLVALDARMEQVYWGQYQVNEQGVVLLIADETVVSPADVKAFELSSENSHDVYGIGDGWGLYQEQMTRALGFTSLTILNEPENIARGILKLAVIRLKQGEQGVSADRVTPVYLR